jgi:hypothetical protein
MEFQCYCGAAAAAADRGIYAAAAERGIYATAAIALKFHPKHEKRKQKTLTKRTNTH